MATLEKCRWPYCPTATRCSQCGRQLCKPELHDAHQVEGHYVRVDASGIERVICIGCYGGRKAGS
jgi:hypothetical protein